MTELRLDDAFPAIFVDYRQDHVQVSIGLYERLLAKSRVGRDALALYLHLQYCYRRQHTNRVWATDVFLTTGTGMGEDRLKRAKTLLQREGLIAYRQDRESKGRKGKVYIELLLVPNPGPEKSGADIFAHQEARASSSPAEQDPPQEIEEEEPDFDDDAGSRRKSYQKRFLQLYRRLYRMHFHTEAPWTSKKDYPLLAKARDRLGEEKLEQALKSLFENPPTRMQSFSFGSLYTFLPEAEQALAREEHRLRLLKTCRGCGKQSNTTDNDCPKCGQPDAFISEGAQDAAQ
jgi:hypothetical protein